MLTAIVFYIFLVFECSFSRDSEGFGDPNSVIFEEK